MNLDVDNIPQGNEGNEHRKFIKMFIKSSFNYVGRQKGGREQKSTERLGFVSRNILLSVYCMHGSWLDTDLHQPGCSVCRLKKPKITCCLKITQKIISLICFHEWKQ